jgi:hypothetical protein
MATTKLRSEDTAAMRGYLTRNLPGDAQWLADGLHERARKGDNRARRLLAHLLRTLQGWGAKVAAPTWPRITSAKRRAELDA